MAGPLSITNCEATAATGTIVVTFSEPVNITTPGTPPSPSAIDPQNYFLQIFPNAIGVALPVATVIRPALNGTAVIIDLPPAGATLTQRDWIQITVNNVTPRGGGTAISGPSNNVFFTQVHSDDIGVAAGDIALNTGSIATSARGTSQAVEDIASFSVLTEEIGYPPSPLARPSGWGGAMAPAAGGMLGQTATKAISDVLGWQVKSDPKGFVGALNASFALKEVEGHTEASWTPRTYAIQTDLLGGISGAQASVYKRAQDALDKSLPLLDGLYPLFKEAKDEDVAALKATIRSQFTDLVNELGLYGGPRISRISQLFSLLLGQQLPQNQAQVAGFPLQTDPDQISGSLGNLRVECGFGQADDQVNTVEDEQDVTNFRIVSDYVTSLAQSWLNNLQFFGLQTQTPFFGTQLVLLSRQLSVIAESVNEVRFTLDSVFIGPAERQTLQINFGSPAPSGTPSMFLEDLLTWVETFASQEGPRLIEEGGKSGVGQSFKPIGEQLQTLVAGAENPANINSLPRGYRTKRVQRSLEELADQLQELVNLAAPIQHIITPEPEPALGLLGINPNVVFLSAWPPLPAPGALLPIQLTIIGTGFDVVAAAAALGRIQDISPSPELDFGRTPAGLGVVTIHSENLASASLLANSASNPNQPPPAGSYTVQITMPHRDTVKFPQPVVLVTSLTILP
jgi:hypothetical protein